MSKLLTCSQIYLLGIEQTAIVSQKWFCNSCFLEDTVTVAFSLSFLRVANVTFQNRNSTQLRLYSNWVSCYTLVRNPCKECMPLHSCTSVSISLSNVQLLEMSSYGESNPRIKDSGTKLYSSQF